MKKFNKNSMAVKLSVNVLLIIILVTTILIGSVVASGAVTEIRDNSYISFSKNSETHKAFMKDQMTLGIANILSYVYDIGAIHEELAQSNGELASDDTTLFLQKSAPIVIDMLNASFTTGAFIILDEDNGGGQHTGLYFRDEEPLIIDKLNKDILFLYGSIEIADSFIPTLKLHPKWEQYIGLTDDNLDILNIPLQKALDNIHIRDSGYWQVSNQVSDMDKGVLTYSMPLIDSNGNAFGILGMGITDDYFHLMVSPDENSELVEDGSLGHILATFDENTNEVVPVLVYGDIQHNIAPLGIPLKLSTVNEELSLYKIENTDTDFSVLSSIYALELYEDNTSNDEQWVLIGLANQDQLDASATNFITTLYVIFWCIVIGGVFIAFLVGLKLAKPITTLANKVETNDIETILSLSKTKSGYSEIDGLAGAIERFNRKVLDASLKADNIIRMVNLPLGTFEYDKDATEIKCSVAVLELLALQSVLYDNNSVPRDVFEKRIEEIKENVEDEYNQIYFIEGDPNTWLKIIIIENDTNFLGICMDVTKEIIDKHSITTQRDAELARFVKYICKANSMIMEINLQDMSCKKYQLDEQGSLVVQSEHYETYHYQNTAETNYPTAFSEIVGVTNEQSIDEFINDGSERYYECLSKDKDGKYRWYAYTIQPITPSLLYPRNFILYKKDIDKTKRAEDEKKQALSDALATARSSSEAKSFFLSRMSHEIRTPLNAVIGYMAIAKDSEDDTKKILHCIENSELSAKHLLRLINDVLDMSSIESGRFKIAKESFDLKALISTGALIFFNQSKDKGVKFTVQINNLTEEWVIGDQLRLNQVLMNLLSNAVKFTQEGGEVSLVVTQLDRNDKVVHIKFEIADTGIGMAEGYMSHIFTPFEQEDAHTAQQFGGTGLGLSIAKNLVTMMGGSIEVKSKQGVGTTFAGLLSFPLSFENKKNSDIQHDFSDVRALIVDDDQGDCNYIKMLFKRCGVKSDTVLSGEKAIRQVKIREQTDHPYDLCIIDWNMSGLNGIEITRRLREECSFKRPIIIATAYDLSAIDTEAREAGADKVISKPLFQSTLFDLLVSNYENYVPLVPEDAPAFDLAGIQLLLVEDNPMNMEISVNLFEKAGLVVDQATNGKEGLDKFLSSEKGFYQAILMDVQMPIMDGYEATKAIRESNHPAAKDVPIIAMTANAFVEDVSKALASGMNAHVSKPVDYKKLFQALEKNIKKEGR